MVAARPCWTVLGEPIRTGRWPLQPEPKWGVVLWEAKNPPDVPARGLGGSFVAALLRKTAY